MCETTKAIETHPQSMRFLLETIVACKEAGKAVKGMCQKLHEANGRPHINR